MPHKNKEDSVKYHRQRYLDNKEKILKYQQEYQQSPEGKKSYRIASWKTMGLLWETQDEIDKIYERYLTSKRCEACDEEYTETNIKNMDHEHQDGKYGKFRNVLCHSCNVKTDRQINSDNTSGVSNVRWCNTDKRWLYCKMINGKIHKKRFPYFIQAVIYKREYEESLL